MGVEQNQVPDPAVLDQELEGHDALELPLQETAPLTKRLWQRHWPSLAAAAAVLAVWQGVVLVGYRPSYIIPPPYRVASELLHFAGDPKFWSAVATTMTRAVTGFALAVLLGSGIGFAVSGNRVLRRALGSLITGLQSMPSIAWFPFAILLFGLTESAILFVVVLGASPSVANGLIGGIDHIPPILLRAGRVLGARGFANFLHVKLPAALPGYLAGLKQGWAFSWRSLMAGELLVIIETRPALGSRLQFARELSDTPALFALMIVILVIGVLVDSLFGALESKIRRQRGLVDQA